MTVTSSWQIPDRVILHKVTDGLTADDIEEMNRAVNGNKSARMLHQIIDISDMTKAPGIGVLRHHSRSASDNDGYIVVIGNLSRLVEFTVTTIAQITNFRVLVVASVDKAIPKLRHLDPTL